MAYLTRLRALNGNPASSAGGCVLYVASRDPRLSDNHGLAAAQALALERKLPLAVVFCLQPRAGRRAREHFEFLLTGLGELEAGLAARNIPFMLLVGEPLSRLRGLLHHLTPAALYFDFNPLRGPQNLHAAVAAEAPCAVYEADSHNIVPAWLASPKLEIGARTFRSKVMRLLPEYLQQAAPPLRRHPHDWPGTVRSIDELATLTDEVLDGLTANGTDITRFVPGEAAAQAALGAFIEQRLDGYAERRNDPAQDYESHLSPYLHYGLLSAAEAVRAVSAAAAEMPRLQADADAFIEQLVVRKELSDNFCLYQADYDSLKGAPAWALLSIERHREDPRPFIYSRGQLEYGMTQDPGWNASQLQLIRSGKMHSYMRMYWAKKVLEWSASPEEALETLLYLNDFYSIDGGDPNGYAGILWSLAGLHDRPWPDRAVFGTVRSMVYGGLKRKFDIAAYEARWQP
jgi:deoxyribodipyrimidine photo-lyase